MGKSYERKIVLGESGKGTQEGVASVEQVKYVEEGMCGVSLK